MSASRLYHQLPQYIAWRWFSIGLEITTSVCFTTILNCRKCITESSDRPDQHDRCYACLAELVIVSNPTENDYQKSNSLTKSSKSLTRFRRENSSSNSELVTETGGMASIRQNLSSKGLSEISIGLISDARRTGSQSNYESAWRKWFSWYHRKQTDKPRYCFVRDIETILRYFRSLLVNKLLSTKMLTLKLTMLLALTSASRCSEIRHLDTRFYTKSERIFFYHLGFLSQPFTNHRTAGEGEGHFFNSSLPLPPASQTLRH